MNSSYKSKIDVVQFIWFTLQLDHLPFGELRRARLRWRPPCWSEWECRIWEVKRLGSHLRRRMGFPLQKAFPVFCKKPDDRDQSVLQFDLRERSDWRDYKFSIRSSDSPIDSHANEAFLAPVVLAARRFSVDFSRRTAFSVSGGSPSPRNSLRRVSWTIYYLKVFQIVVSYWQNLQIWQYRDCRQLRVVGV